MQTTVFNSIFNVPNEQTSKKQGVRFSVEHFAKNEELITNIPVSMLFI